MSCPLKTKVKDPESEKTQQKWVELVHTDGTIDLVDTRAVGGNVNDLPKGYFWSAQFVGTVLAQCIASIVAYVGWVLPANTIAIIYTDLSGHTAAEQWATTIWGLGSCIGFLLVGRLSDMFGRKWMVQGTTLLSLVGCLVGATATRFEAIVGANLCNGLASAGQLSFGIVLGELVPNRHRGPIVTLVFLSSLPFAVFGGLFARLFVERTSAGWRWNYILGAIFSVLAGVLYHFFYHPPSFGQLHMRGKTKWEMVRALDFVGIVLFVAGCVLFLIGLSWGGTTYPWASAPTLCTLLGGIAILVMFVVYEGHFCKVQPLMPPRLFKNVGFSAIVAIACVGVSVYYSFTVLWPTIIGSLYTTDSLQIGLQSAVVGGGVLLGQVLGGLAIAYVPRVKLQTIVAGCLGLAFITPLVTLTEHTHARTLALGVLGCTAMGYVDNIAFPGITLVSAPADIGLATGVMGSLRALAGAFTQTLYLSVLNNKLAVAIPSLVGPAALDAGLPAASLDALLADVSAGTSVAQVPGITSAIEKAVADATKEAYAAGFRLVFLATIPFSVVLVGAACLVPNMEAYLHQDVAKRLQGKHVRSEKGDGGVDLGDQILA